MLDFSQVLRFEQRLIDAAETSDIEAGWKRETVSNIADEMHPPIRTGALKSSIHPTDEGVAMLDYWRYLEYGTVHMAPQPFVRPAIARETEPALDDLGNRVIRELL